MNKLFMCRVLESNNFTWIILWSEHFARIVDLSFKLLINSNPLVLFMNCPKTITAMSQHYLCIFFPIHLIHLIQLDLNKNGETPNVQIILKQMTNQ